MGSPIVRESAQSVNDYRELASYPGYRFYADGTITSCRRTGRAGFGESWHEIVGCITGLGRRLVTLTNVSGVSHVRQAHVLILEAFVGPRPDGMVCCHANDNALDNRISNLRWDTNEANYADRDANGKTARGERNGHAKLLPETVIEIRELAEAGATNIQLANEFGVNDRCISMIVTGRSWLHVGGPIRVPDRAARRVRSKDGKFDHSPVAQRRFK